MQVFIPKFTTAVGILISVLIGGAALAEDNCVDPVANWQSREVLRQQIEQRGWTIKRIKVDDGCYEVRGVDSKGNKFKATYAPVSLQIQALEIRFGKNADTSDYLLPGKQAK